MSKIESIDPRTGEVRRVVTQATAPAELDAVCERALAAYDELAGRDRSWRADMLRAMADSLEKDRDLIVSVADAETALGEPRLTGELTRTCFQLRMFADVVEEGGYLEATVDPARETDMGPRPDLRRMLVPTGPVAVFGASNFPLAFSVPGGDTASALAAGCPVVVKAHGSHPETSLRCAQALQSAAEDSGAPQGTIAVVFGRPAGEGLVTHPAITAVGFTGSITGGQALMELMAQREVPIPFYGELGSVNPLVVTGQAADERAEEIAKGLVGSFTLGVGQFCTKPGLALVPAGAGGDELVAAAVRATDALDASPMLNAGISEGFDGGVERLLSIQGSSLLAPAETRGASGKKGWQRPHLIEVPASALEGPALEECFGPETLVVRYDDDESLDLLVQRLPSSLTATVHTGADGALDPRVRRGLEKRAGRVVYNGFPTGVAVSWAQHHGGGWPATNSLHTSVGATAIRRFMRPMAWQDAPAELLPAELRDDYTAIPRRVDGVLQTPTRQ